MFKFSPSPAPQRDLDSVFGDLELLIGTPIEVEFMDLRGHAVVEFFRRIPIEDYRCLKILRVDKGYFDWFIPAADNLGQVISFEPNIHPPAPRASYCKIIYLSPTLEATEPDVALAVVAVRLAIVLLYNDPRWLGEDEEQIEAGRIQAIEWGFGVQVQKLDARQ
jgi:hypothetical protein